MDYLKETGLQNNSISEETKSNFAGLGQWMNIAAIVGFVGIALSLITTIITYNKINSYGIVSSGMGMYPTVVGFVSICISLFLNTTLFNAAKKIKNGLESIDQENFNFGLNKLATYFKIIAILIIIVLIILGIIILFAGLFATMH